MGGREAQRIRLGDPVILSRTENPLALECKRNARGVRSSALAQKSVRLRLTANHAVHKSNKLSKKIKKMGVFVGRGTRSGGVFFVPNVG